MAVALGTPVSEFWQNDGLTRFGLHELPPIVTRGVVLDMILTIS